MEILLIIVNILSLVLLGYIIKNVDKKPDNVFEPVKRVNEFSKDICKLENKKVQLNIAQVNEVLKCINSRTNGEFYKFIKRGY